MKLASLEGELQKVFVMCRRSDITPTVATRRTTFDMAVKWLLNLRKHFVCSSSISQSL
jgi:hypothetical protein